MLTEAQCVRPIYLKYVAHQFFCYIAFHLSFLALLAELIV